ncbi:AraC family transcriptional regulator [Sphingomonas sp. PAMC 26617]|uniref:AraC family transcriptional regulator n=1 Tax=Sphingomonas sp. PAMC 26617 TaxID=1112216 RepID=UPI00028A3BB2|nr:AraC family transcriptional regulator [Sphingomonas sp. PAMC 26617]
MDPLSDVLSLLKPRSYVGGGFDAAGEWSFQFPQKDGIKCHAVISGECWLSVDGVADPVHLKPGDCFLLASGRPIRLASDAALTPVDAATVYSTATNGGIVSYNGGGNCFIIGGHFILDESQSSFLLGMLPPIIHLRTQSDKAALRWSLERMSQELREPQPGGSLVAQQLAYMMLVLAFRLYLSEKPGDGVGWLFALADKQMAAAISAMHERPSYRWTLQALAQRAGMSRTAFTLKFKATVGSSAMDYLARWRMLLAADRLENSSDPISVMALSLGYESESAFSTAFKRVMGCSPRQHSRNRNPDHLSRNAARIAGTSRAEVVAA